jgi:anthranilate/para-aminobenzoate synthase component I
MVIEKFNGSHPSDWVARYGLIPGSILLDCHTQYTSTPFKQKQSYHLDSNFTQGWSLNTTYKQRKQCTILGLHADDILSRSFNESSDRAKQARSFLHQLKVWSSCEEIREKWQTYISKSIPTQQVDFPHNEHRLATSDLRTVNESNYLIVPSFVLCYFSYELGSALEGVKAASEQVLAKTLADLYAVRYRAIYVWDMDQKQAWIYAYTRCDAELLKTTLKQGYQIKQGHQPTSSMVEQHSKYSLSPQASYQTKGDSSSFQHPSLHTKNITKSSNDTLYDLKVLCTWPDYRSRIQKIHELIRKGEVYQINLTVPFKATLTDIKSHVLYHCLRQTNPSPFGSLIQINDYQAILSLSPERLVQWSLASSISTAPIKGTRARHSDPKKDQILQKELRESIKDRAEHFMIVDLERNDLAKIARSQSVRVPMLCQLHSYSSVHHLISEIKAQLATHVDIEHILHAILPGGSITGAPKVRAMNYISQLEFAPRQVYCGAIGSIDIHGGADFSIPIRTAYHTHNELYYYAGGGIVADSKADEEWKEMWTKAQAIIQGVKMYKNF